MRFLTVEEVIEAHALLTAGDDDRPHVMNRGAIHSAIERAEWGPFEDNGDLSERGALILRGICQDHAFTNGNKRTAFVSAESFLQRNGQLIVASADEVVEFMLKVAEDVVTLKEMASWLRAHARNI